MREIGEMFGINKSTVCRIASKYRSTNSVERKPGSGRPRKSTSREDRQMVRLVQADPRKTAKDVASFANEQMGISIGVHTARRRLNDANLFARRPAKKPLITKANKIKRLDFAKRYRHWSSEQWAKVLWSDESKFNLFGSDGIKYIRRPPKQRFSPRYQLPTVKYGGGSLMVWGSFSRDGVGPLVKIEGIMNADKYCEILQQHMLPHLREKMAPNSIFQQDNDPKHSSRLVRNYLSDHDVQVLDWPSQSPDLNPIENLWEIVDREVKQKNPSNLMELETILKSEWEKVPLNTIVSLVDSMPSRLQAVIKNNGYATKY